VHKNRNGKYFRQREKTMTEYFYQLFILLITRKNESGYENSC